MSSFEYHRPSTVAEASDLLAQEGAVALSGGTDVLVALRHGKTQPRLVVDLKTVGDIGRDIEVDGDTIRIGGRVTMSQLADDAEINRLFPALGESASVVGSVQIRNRATLAGNLCNASPAADTAPALLAYSALVGIDGPTGRRAVPLADFFVGPGVTVLEKGELLIWVEIPIPPVPTGSAFARVTRRRGVDLASVNLACAVDSSGLVRFGFGAVAPTPVLGIANIDDLAGGRGWSEVFGEISPISDLRAGAGYRRAMLEVHSRRALAVAESRLGAAR